MGILRGVTKRSCTQRYSPQMDFQHEPWAFECHQKDKKWMGTDAGDDFEVETTRNNRLGVGVFGAVYQARHKGNTIAAKVHHAFLEPDSYGLDNEALTAIVQELLKEVRMLA